MAKFLKKDNVLTFVDDPTEIEYLKFNNMRFSTIGCMLGDFDDKGIYCVDPRIVKELITMKKFLTSTVENIEVCHSQLKLNKQISFFVVYEGNRVSLILAEKINYQANFKINSGIFSNINEYVLDSVETSGKIDRNVIYRRWNIDPYPGEVLDIFHMDEESIAIYFNLTKRFKYLMRANEILLASEENLEKIESNYATEMLEIIAKYPALKAILAKDLKEIFTDKKEFLRIDKPNFSKTLNEVISQAVDQNLDVLSEEDKKYFLSEKRHAQLAYNIAVAKEVPTAMLITRDVTTDEVINKRQIVATRSLEQKDSVNAVAASYTKQRTETEANAQNDEASHKSVEKVLKDKYSISAPRSMVEEAVVGSNAEVVNETPVETATPVKTATPVEKKQGVKKAPAVKKDAKATADKGTNATADKDTKATTKKGAKATNVKGANATGGNGTTRQETARTTGVPSYVGGTSEQPETTPNKREKTIIHSIDPSVAFGRDKVETNKKDAKTPIKSKTKTGRAPIETKTDEQNQENAPKNESEQTLGNSSSS